MNPCTCIVCRIAQTHAIKPISPRAAFDVMNGWTMLRQSNGTVLFTRFQTTEVRP